MAKIPKTNWRQHHKVLTLIVTLGLLLRLIPFSKNFQFNHMDFVGDYVTAHNIVAYGEFPTIGQENSVYGLINSPLYEYLLALFLLIKDDMWTLAFLNVFFEIITIASLYGLAYMLFGRKVALLAVTLLAFNKQFVQQTFILWLPSGTQPFVYASYFFLARGYIQEKISSIFIASILFMIAVGIGLYAIPLLPLFLMLIWVSLKKMKANWPIYVCIFAIILILGIGVYLPVFLYLLNTEQLSLFFDPKDYTNLKTQYISQLLEGGTILFTEIMGSTMLGPLKKIAYLLLVLCALRYFFLPKLDSRRIYSGVLFFAVIFVLAINSLLSTNEYHRLVGIAGILVILLSEIVVFAFSKNKFLTTLCVATLIAVSMVDVPYLRHIFTRSSIIHEQEEAANAMLPAFAQMKNIYGDRWPEHYKIATYNSNTHNAADGVFWALLEQKTQRKLTRLFLNGTWGHHFKPLGVDDSFIIVVCTDYANIHHAQAGCLSEFISEYPQHHVEKLLLDTSNVGRYIIYMATRSDIHL